MISDDIVLRVSVVIIVLFGSCRANLSVGVIVPNDRDKLVNAVTNLQNIRLATMKTPTSVAIENDISNKPDNYLKFLLQEHVRNLRCTYMLNALQHLRLTRNLLVYNQPDWTEIKDLISMYKDNVAPDMIETLYDLGVRELNLLWMFYMYVDELSKLQPDDPVIAATEWSMRYKRDIANILSIHVKIVEEFVTYANTIVCRNNVYIFATEEYKFDQCGVTDPVKREACMNHVKKLVVENFKSISNLMKNNENHDVVASKNPAFLIERLYLNDAVKSAEFMGELIHTFDVQMDWGSVSYDLVESNRLAHDLDVLKQNMWTMVRAYQLKFYNFLKLLVIRMARKHLKYQNYYDSFGGIVWTAGRKKKYTDYTSDIKTILKNFIDLLKLPQDDELREILDAIEKKAFKFKVQGRLQEILSFVKNKEKSLMTQFKNIKTHSMSKDSRKLVTFDMEKFVNKHNIKIDKPFPDEPIRPIELNLIKMKILHQYLLGHNALRYINFEVIAAFINSRQ